MERGESLSQALGVLGRGVPAAYRAVVEAGLRSGRLSEALEGVAEQAWRRLDLRRTIEQAMAYPVLVLGLAYGMGLVFLATLALRLREAAEALGVRESWAIEFVGVVAETMPFWAAVPVAAAGGLVLIWWLLGRRGWLGGVDLMERLPWVGGILGRGRRAGFAGWLGLLLEHGVPLPEALRLAGGASGDRALEGAAGRAAEGVRAGKSLEEAGRELPAWLGHALVVGEVSGDLPGALRAAARHDRRRAEHQAELLREWLPGVMVQVVGGVAVLVYVAMLFVPWASLLEGLARPAS